MVFYRSQNPVICIDGLGELKVSFFKGFYGWIHILQLIKSKIYSRGTKLNSTEKQLLEENGYDPNKFKLGKLCKRNHESLNTGKTVQIASFSFRSADDPEFHTAWALENLQPLERMENFRKGNRLDHSSQKSYQKS